MGGHYLAVFPSLTEQNLEGALVVFLLHCNFQVHKIHSMTDEMSAKVTEDSKVTPDAGSNAGATTTVRQRKKRKWDQPAESLISAGLAVPAMLPFVGAGALPGIGLPGMVSPLVRGIPSAAMQSSFMSTPQVSSTIASSVVQQNAVAIVQKINQDLATKGLLPQSKIQDELLFAREIVINDADPTVRYKLTKRQTQEDIQAKTGAVVITRGRYRPPNGPAENEKPLYLHISAGAHLKDTAERIKAVDLAAIMVEEIMKQGRQIQSASNPFSVLPSPGVLAGPPFNAAVYVGLEAEPTLNLVSRIRGPNDQYINHIMNETGATVVLRGRGSGNYEGLHGEELQQPLHLYISSENVKSFENAKSLAENLLETIRSEFLTSRSSTYQVAAASSMPCPAMPSAALQSSISPYQVSSYPTSTLGVGPYAGIYPQAVVSYTQAPATSYSLSSSLPQPGSVNLADLISTDPYINMSSTTKVYNAVPPPQQLLSESEVAKADTEKTNGISTESTSRADLTAVTPSSSNAAVSSAAIAASCISAQPILVSTGTNGMQGAVTSNAQNCISALPCLPSYGQPTPISIPQVQQSQQIQSPYMAGTNYSGYGGIYPQATPLQQVALALQRPPPPVSVRPGFTHSTSAPPTKAQSSYSNGESEKQPAQRRKFQELPVVARERSRDNQNSLQGTEFSKFGELAEPSTKKLHSMPPPKNVPVGLPKSMPPPPAQSMHPPSAHSMHRPSAESMPQPSSKSMPPPSAQSMLQPSSKSMPPPSRSMPPPSSRGTSPPSSRSMSPPQIVSLKTMSESKTEGSSHHVSETTIKLVEYGEEDDDDSSAPGTPNVNGTQYANGKPFWAP